MPKKMIVAAIMIAGSSASSVAQDTQKGAAVFNVWPRDRSRRAKQSRP